MRNITNGDVNYKLEAICNIAKPAISLTIDYSPITFAIIQQLKIQFKGDFT